MNGRKRKPAKARRGGHYRGRKTPAQRAQQRDEGRAAQNGRRGWATASAPQACGNVADGAPRGALVRRGRTASPEPAHASAAETRRRRERELPVYGALDLGTNNCRLLIAKPTRRGFQVIDAFSRIIRLGEGVSASGRLSSAAVDRTLEALKVCATKMARNNVTRSKLVATEACRAAENGTAFIDRVRREIGMSLEILSQESEAHLAVSGCASLIDENCDHALVFDIGGGSSELIWLDIARRRRMAQAGQTLDHSEFITAWTSLPVGVVSLAERFGGRHVEVDRFEEMVNWVMGLIAPFEATHRFRDHTAGGRVHFLGTSGTVTTVAGIQLRLPRYDRRRVDGCWLNSDDVRSVTFELLDQTYEERVAQPCIGRDRADLVLAGCAILEALMRTWPTERLRVADRGLREGMLTNMMAEDGFLVTGQAGLPPSR